MTNEKAGNSKKGNGTPEAVQKLTFFLNHIYKLKSFTHISYHNSVHKKKKKEVEVSKIKKHFLSHNTGFLGYNKIHAIQSPKATYTYALWKVFCCVFFTLFCSVF